MVTVVAKLKVQPGKEQAFRQEAEKMIGYVEANEPGTQAYVLHQAAADPTEFMFYEIYADQAALDAHGKSDGMKQFFGTVGGLLAGRPDIAFYQELAGKK